MVCATVWHPFRLCMHYAAHLASVCVKPCVTWRKVAVTVHKAAQRLKVERRI